MFIQGKAARKGFGESASEVGRAKLAGKYHTRRRVHPMVAYDGTRIILTLHPLCLLAVVL